MANSYEKAEDPKGHSAAGSTRNVDARLHYLSRRAELHYLSRRAELHYLSRRAELHYLSRRAELHYLTVQVGRVAQAELDAYRKVEGTYNA